MEFTGHSQALASLFRKTTLSLHWLGRMQFIFSSGINPNKLVPTCAVLCFTRRAALLSHWALQTPLDWGRQGILCPFFRIRKIKWFVQGYASSKWWMEASSPWLWTPVLYALHLTMQWGLLDMYLKLHLRELWARPWKEVEERGSRSPGQVGTWTGQGCRARRSLGNFSRSAVLHSPL